MALYAKSDVMIRSIKIFVMGLEVAFNLYNPRLGQLDTALSVSFFITDSALYPVVSL